MTRNRRIATVGYEGKDLEDFVATLMTDGIKRLVDIRELPLSRKKGFSKSALRDALSRSGIEYAHLRALGAPREARHALRAGGSFAKFRSAYAGHLHANRSALADLSTLAERESTAIMCFERDHAVCHRSLVGAALEGEGYRVEHLD